jgi:digeranylgeranylglycerophospholipid reductase
MTDEYDFVVVGGGPAGLQFARAVSARSDYSIAVLERNERLSDNDKSSAATFPEVVEGFDLPDQVVMSETESVTLEGPTTRSSVDMRGFILDFPRLLTFLGREAAANGTDVRTETTVTDPLVEDGAVEGVRYRDADGEAELRAKITVDATGPDAVLTSALGFFDRTVAQRGIGLEFEAEGKYDTENSMLLKFDHEVAPGGYAWTFPAGTDVFKIGVCWVDDFRARRGTDNTIHDYVERWVAADPRWEVEAVRAKHAGEIRSDNSIHPRAADGFLAVGDSVSSVNPLFGEGIRPAMESAAMAVDVALAAMDDDDRSAARLRAYERRWNEERGRHWKRQRIVGELLYDFDAGQQDAFVERVGGLSPRQLERLRRYELTMTDLVRLYPWRVDDVTKLPRLARHL